MFDFFYVVRKMDGERIIGVFFVGFECEVLLVFLF